MAKGGTYAGGVVGLDINTQVQGEGTSRDVTVLTVGSKESAQVMCLSVDDASEPAAGDNIRSALSDGGSKGA